MQLSLSTTPPDQPLIRRQTKHPLLHPPHPSLRCLHTLPNHLYFHLPSRFRRRLSTLCSPLLTIIPSPRPHRLPPLPRVPRDSSVGPVRAPFRMWTSLSSIPAGSGYRPNPKWRERNPSEPPPLTALMSNPIFVKPPPNHSIRSLAFPASLISLPRTRFRMSHSSQSTWRSPFCQLRHLSTRLIAAYRSVEYLRLRQHPVDPQQDLRLPPP